MSALDIALEFIKKAEGCKLKAYRDEGGVPTIGYGQTGRHITMDSVWSQAEADDALVHYVTPLLDVVEDLVRVEVTDNQMGALVSLAYNIGTSAFARSTVLRELNKKHFDEAADAFMMWHKVNGASSPGLLKRRQRERALFLRP